MQVFDSSDYGKSLSQRYYFEVLACQWTALGPRPKYAMRGNTGLTCAACGVELARLQANPLSQGKDTAVAATALHQQGMLAKRPECVSAHRPGCAHHAGPKIMQRQMLRSVDASDRESLGIVLLLRHCA